MDADDWLVAAVVIVFAMVASPVLLPWAFKIACRELD